MLRRCVFMAGLPRSSQQCGFVSLQVEKPCTTLAEKIVRGAASNVFYAHPSYVMSREKMLYTIWVDNGVFSITSRFLTAFFVVGFFFKA
uniref:Uncharacterized protein n=1 Tax=Trypanosoma vivax (strain Y486) TaxID=1055687 RepID=G0TZL4_TRYVY|nr:conserved hypothetical protein [Trypanosoma vivax Y486]